MEGHDKAASVYEYLGWEWVGYSYNRVCGLHYTVFCSRLKTSDKKSIFFCHWLSWIIWIEQIPPFLSSVQVKQMPRLKLFDPGSFQGHIVTGSRALLLSRSQSAQVSDVIYMDISASGTFLSTRLNAVHLLERRCFVIMEKYASLKKQRKKQFPAITVALLYFAHLNKRDVICICLIWLTGRILRIFPSKAFNSWYTEKNSVL